MEMEPQVMQKDIYRPAPSLVIRAGRWAMGLLVLAIVLAGCAAPSSAGGYGQPAATSAPAGNGSGQAAGQTVKVSLKDFAFAPKVLTVTAGTTVEWHNDDSTAHTVTADNGSFDSGNLGQGATYRFTFAKAGTYAYYCRYHGGPGGQGMSGQIVVK
jgi:plastocyanin